MVVSVLDPRKAIIGTPHHDRTKSATGRPVPRAAFAESLSGFGRSPPEQWLRQTVNASRAGLGSRTRVKQPLVPLPRAEASLAPGGDLAGARSHDLPPPDEILRGSILCLESESRSTGRQVGPGFGVELQFGTARAGYGNRQFTLSVTHWLSRAI